MTHLKKQKGKKGWGEGERKGKEGERGREGGEREGEREINLLISHCFRG